MKIGRKVADFGNSFNNFMVDGYYIELATNVVKISKKKLRIYLLIVFLDQKIYWIDY